MKPAGKLTADRVLMATAAALLGLLAILYIGPPALSQLGRPSNWLWMVYAIPLLILPFALLIPAVIWPRSVVAAVVAALPVGFLLMLGMNAEPTSLPRFGIHLAAILCLAVLVGKGVRGVVKGEFRVLWIALALLLGFAIGFLATAPLGLHIRTQFCNWPPFGAEISSILCSG